ncbi:carboxypeptidase-like regulatory domain-containing protein [Foetidibacter luteolus]|uniref:carboxypeptidase-like regulatory domain-containing protein n=1 Tax=Foetidibacter luteolus TaxID=2608880 RepID=UPI00129A1C4A|nr:carboxypeptidase-like regulatory domain-containing protein [Foetidibacter luteolus]
MHCQRIIYSALFCLVCCAAPAQALTGKVLDKETQKVIAGASVFISNTGYGTVSANDGSFSFSKLPPGEFDLVVSVIGYETFVVHITAPQKQLLVQLQPKANELQDVVVSSYEKDGWQKWGGFFLESFIGESAYARQCKIKNYKTIKFRYSSSKNYLTAHAMEPLIIENKALGYELKYEMVEFSYDFKSHYLLYVGYPLFIEMEGSASRRKKWEKNRKDVYTGSVMHFMRAIYRNKVPENGFEMRRLEKIVNKEKQRVKGIYDYYVRIVTDADGNKSVTNDIDHFTSKDSLRYYEKIMRQEDVKTVLHPQLVEADSIAYAEDSITAGLYFKDHLLVTYPSKQEAPEYYVGKLGRRKDPYVTSTIVLVNGNPVSIQSNGSYYNPVEVMTSGYWGWSEKIATTLPFDYEP